MCLTDSFSRTASAKKKKKKYNSGSGGQFMPLHHKLDYAYCIGREISNASRNWAESLLDYIEHCTHHHLCESKSQCSNIRSLSFHELKRKMQT